jgi:hypothetical protein
VAESHVPRRPGRLKLHRSRRAQAARRGAGAARCSSA